MSKLEFVAITPDRTVMKKEVDYVVLRTAEGELGVLPGHEACCLRLADDVVKLYQARQQTDTLAVLEGFATIRDNRVAVIAAVAERPERLEALLAEMERKRREKEKQEERSALEIHRVETALRRILVQSDVSAYSVLRGNEPGGKRQEEAHDEEG